MAQRFFTTTDDPIAQLFRFFAQAHLDSASGASAASNVTFAPPTRRRHSDRPVRDVYEGGSMRSVRTAPETHRRHAVRFTLKRLLGGKARAEFKNRLSEMQHDILQTGQEAQDCRRLFNEQAHVFRQGVRQRQQISQEAGATLQIRARVISLMHTFGTYDATLHATFCELDQSYRTVYAQAKTADNLLVAQLQDIRAILAALQNINERIGPTLVTYRALQADYLKQYGRLPAGVSEASHLEPLFALPKEPELKFGAVLPPPQILEMPPPRFMSQQHSPNSGGHRPQTPPPPPPKTEAHVGGLDHDVSMGMSAAQRLQPWLVKLFAGDAAAWGSISIGDLTSMAAALSTSAIRRGGYDPATDRARRDIALMALGVANVSASEARKRYKRCQLTVHPDKTRNLPAATRAKADKLCLIIGDAVDELDPT